MIITRWQAETPLDQDLALSLFKAEDLDPFIEEIPPNNNPLEHRHPFYEILVVLKGELLCQISGTQFLLRPGDRVEIPAHTKHSYRSHSSEPCLCICSYRFF